MKKYVFTIKDDQLNIALVNTFMGKVRIEAIHELQELTLSKLIDNYSMIVLDQIRDPLYQFIRRTNKSVKDADVVIGLDSIISRTIEIPYLSKRHMQSYINHNITNFFTVDMEDYFYDYKIIQIIPKTKETPKKIGVKLIVIPKTTIIGINKLIQSLDLKLKSIGIYPDIMQRIAVDNEAIGVLDIGTNKSLFTIYDEGSTFIYSTIDNQGENQEDFADEIEYFTDFFAARHQGQGLQKLYMTGSQSENVELQQYLSERLGIQVGPIDYNRFKKMTTEVDMSKYPSIILSQKKTREIRGDEIDFSEDEALKEKKDRSFQPVYLFFILAVLTAAWFVLYTNYLDNQMRLYQVEIPDSTVYADLQLENEQFTQEKERLLSVQSNIEKMEAIRYDYHALFDVIVQKTPSNINIENMTIEKDRLTISITNIPSTLDVLNYVITINNTGLFEPLQIEDIVLDDVLEQYELLLLPRMPDQHQGDSEVETN